MGNAGGKRRLKYARNTGRTVAAYRCYVALFAVLRGCCWSLSRVARDLYVMCTASRHKKRRPEGRHVIQVKKLY